MLGTDVKFLEFGLDLTLGVAIASRYGSQVKWIVLFLVWSELDFLDHLLLERNPKSAVVLGDSYLAWALMGQSRLALGNLARLTGVQ